MTLLVKLVGFYTNMTMLVTLVDWLTNLLYKHDFTSKNCSSLYKIRLLLVNLVVLYTNPTWGLVICLVFPTKLTWDYKTSTTEKE